MSILITGSAGFIGSELAYKLLKTRLKIIGVDNHNNYYDSRLKNKRVNRLKKFKNYKHYKFDILNQNKLLNICKKHKVRKVIHLAGQAGVRYSLVDPSSYLDSNIVGFFNVLNVCKILKMDKLLYASTSSVYGLNKKLPFSENDNTDHPISFYSATKKCNEIMAHSYSYLYNIKTIGLRFFTVYGPWGRPDMALFKFVDHILNNKKIKIYNKGDHIRDFTYIDDITDGIIKLLKLDLKKDLNFNLKNPSPSSSICPWRIYNIGSNKKIKLMEFIHLIEKILNKKAKIQYLPLQKGDVKTTYANISKIKSDAKYKPSTDLYKGVSKFINWYLNYYNYKYK
jgi:UDP-glucuronate 4-epimerase